MPEPTPEAWAQIRHDYEHTDKPLAHICAEHEITIPMMRYRMKRWEWTRRKPLIPRHGPPPVPVMPADVFSPPPVRAANGGEGSGVGATLHLTQLRTPPRPPSRTLRRATLPLKSLRPGARKRGPGGRVKR